MITSRQGRSPGGGQLPAIRYYQDDVGAEDDEDTAVQGQLTHRLNPAVTSNRLSNIENRLAQQEHTTNALLDRALKIKKDVIESLDLTHGSWYEEKQARHLLRDHIRTITDIVKKLSRDIEYLEARVHDRDGATVGTQTVVKNLELNQIVGVTDLRGRVVRCDTSIARLAADVKTAFDSMRILAQQQVDQKSQMVENMHSLDTRIRDIRAILDKSHTEQTMQLQHVQSGTNHQLSDFDARNQLTADRLRQEMQVGRTREQTEREKMEARIFMHFEKALAQQDVRLNKIEQKIEESVTALQMKLLRMEEEITKENERAKTFQEAFESRMRATLDSSLSQQNEEIGRFKRESRTGFSTVHDNITEVKKVLEGKLEILEERLRKEIGQLRKMVVLV